MSTEIIGTSPVFQEWVDWIREVIEKGLQPGFRQGFVRGFQQGKAEGLREAALVVLHSRFGELAPDLTSAISSAEVTTLEAILPHFATATLEDLRTRLGLGSA